VIKQLCVNKYTTFLIVCPWDLFRVTQIFNLIGYCLLLNMYDYSSSSEYKLILRMKIVLPFCGPEKTLVSITYFLIFIIINRVPLHKPLVRFKFLIKITIEFGFNNTWICNSCGGSAVTSNSLRSSNRYTVVLR